MLKSFQKDHVAPIKDNTANKFNHESKACLKNPHRQSLTTVKVFRSNDLAPRVLFVFFSTWILKIFRYFFWNTTLQIAIFKLTDTKSLLLFWMWFGYNRYKTIFATFGAVRIYSIWMRFLLFLIGKIVNWQYKHNPLDQN